MSGLPVQINLCQGGRGDPLIAVGELEILGVALELIADDRALGQPQREAFPNGLINVVDVELAAQLFMIPGERFFVGVHVGVELFLRLEGPGVDARHHHVAGVAAPIGASEAPQLEGIPGDGLRGIHVGAFAHIHEGAVTIEGQLREVMALKKRFRVFPLVGLPHFLEARHGGVVGQVLAVEALALLDDLPHAPLDFREVRIG